jgi:hypothetical protein
MKTLASAAGTGAMLATSHIGSGGRLMRKRPSYENKHGKDLGGKLYTALQKEAAHASVASRLKKKLKLKKRPKKKSGGSK